MNPLLLGAALLAGLVLLWAWLTRADPRLLAALIRWLSALLGVALSVWMVLGGRWTWIPFLLLFVAPWIRRWFRFAAPGAPAPGASQSSTVTARFLRLTLDHATGAVAGEVLEGAFAGRKLNDLNLPDALALWRECAADPDSLRLMESYLDRVHGAAWRQADAPPAAASPDAMTVTEARAVLGVGAGASEVEIEAAFRRVMRRAHPDQGGSDWLAAKVNRARAVLLGR